MKKKDDIINNGSNIGITDNFFKDFTEFRNKTEEELTSINNRLKLMKKNIPNDSERNDLQLNDNNINNFNQTFGNADSIKPIDLSLLNNPNSPQNQQYIISFINQLQENDKLILQNLTHKVNRDEIEKLQKQISLEVEKGVRNI